MTNAPPIRAAFTYFHALWLSAAFCGALLGFGLPHPPTPMWLRIVAAACGALVGLLAGGIAVAVLVIWIVIPRLTPGSIWSNEVDCYMLSILGEEWENAGRDVQPARLMVVYESRDRDLYFVHFRSDVPCEGEMRCTVVERLVDSQGEQLVRIDTELPDDIESNEGKTVFVVRASQVASSGRQPRP